MIFETNGLTGSTDQDGRRAAVLPNKEEGCGWRSPDNVGITKTLEAGNLALVHFNECHLNPEMNQQ